VQVVVRHYPVQADILAAGEMQTTTRYLSFQLRIGDPWSKPARRGAFISATRVGRADSES
jgi:hypothetical protein